MSDISFEKPVLTKADIANSNMFILGMMHYYEQSGETCPYVEVPDILPSIPENIEPFANDSYLKLIDKAIDENTITSDNLSPEQFEKLKSALQKIGLGEYAEDGVISTNEFIVAGAAVGNAHLEKNPEKFDLTDQEIEAAEKFVAKHGIEDPDGSIAKGVAANAERITDKVNQGLGFEKTPELTAQSPALSGSAPNVTAYAL